MKLIEKSAFIIILCLALLLLNITRSFAAAYDDFKGTRINSNKWEVNSDRFRQPGLSFCELIYPG
jgi:hypothetical protein